MRVRTERDARLAWSFLVEPGDVDAGALVRSWGAVEAWERVSTARGLPEDRRWHAAFARWRPRMTLVDLDDQRRRADLAGARHLVPSDAEWPTRLDDLGDHAPLGLHVRGDATALTRSPGIAVVGARAATGYGEYMTSEIVGDLDAHHVNVISGAAYGIDGAAHRAALATAQTTIAVLAGGCDRVYPAGHASLIAEIARVGAVVAETPLGTTPTRWRFLARNRLIAAMAEATVVVEAGWRSGSLNTAGHAASLARPLGAVPGPVTSAASAGCHRLLREFDAVCVTSGRDAAELAGLQAATGDAPADAPVASVSALDDVERVSAVLSRRVSRTVDDVARGSGIAIAEAEAALGLLLLEGRAARDGSGWRDG